MKAIVLTFDRYRVFTDHMIFTYQRLWPDNPFVFCVPYNDAYPQALKDKYKEKIELIKAPAPIKETMKTLLADISDEEWIWWCMNDRYLVRIKAGKVNDIYNFVLTINDPAIVSISPARVKGSCAADRFFIKGSKLVTPDGQNLLESIFSKSDKLPELWNHHFIRAGVLRKVFESFPARPFSAKEMDYFPKKKLIGERMFVSEQNLVIFGESTSRGEITANCAVSLKKYGFKIPEDFKVCSAYHLKGDMPFNFLCFSFNINIPWVWRLRVVSFLLRLYRLK